MKMRLLFIFLYLAINIFIYVLNFEVFNSKVNLDFGFGIYRLMPLIFIQIIGLVFLLAFFFLDKYKETIDHFEIEKLEDKYKILEQEQEINSLKSHIENISKDEEAEINPADPTETENTEVPPN